ncbi:hypothetical protein VTK73DRAFT_4967 [Phialemonium thermophilum]|uniref:Uncharacterized protein n=1 Tax=Phialemonium thermophilum TaxID=223376 RepID=A0ABR3XZ28_9PEZI
MDTSQVGSHERPHREMLEKSRLLESLFRPPSLTQRPMSVTTEFMEDWEDEIISDLDDGENSPRASLNSSGGQRSITTLSSYDEIHTPRSSGHRPFFVFDSDGKQVEGPKGPHLFRSSVASEHSIEFQHALSLSPLTPKDPNPTTQFPVPIALDLTPLPKKKRDSGPFRFTVEELDTSNLSQWSPEMVAQQMLNAGVEQSACERFVENDITGAVLITLKFEDLRELGIPSFGVRTKIWDEIHNMRHIKPSEPAPETDIEDEPDREARREMRRQDSVKTLRRGRSKRPHKHDDVISPLESVSIVGIEQVMPKPHNCSKGEKCPKWQRNKRMMDAFLKDHPFVDTSAGVIMVAGDPGNPETAEAIMKSEDEVFRPVSDAIPSVVASSDVLGPGNIPTFQYLAEATLRNVQARDPQDNVRQFLDFQQQHVPCSSEVPPTPPFEIVPSNQPHQGLRSLPKLSIPSQAPLVPRTHPASAHPLTAYRHEETLSPEELTPTGVYRFGTPFSDMDVPLTAVPLGPVAREVSQSVPPDMNYRPQQAPPSRSMSRASGRRPSFPVLPALDENSIVTPATVKSPQSFAQRTASGQRPLQPPPRVQYPWTKPDHQIVEHAIPPVPGSNSVINVANGVATKTVTPRVPSSRTGTGSSTTSSSSSAASSGNQTSISSKSIGPPISYQGLMKKRKTKMLRHEWHEHYFTLRGTRLAMHKDVTATNRTLEYIDIDDYAIACSSLASGKLNAAFKAMSIRRGGGSSSAKDDVGAFSFQLIPQDQKGGVRLRKRESSAAGAGMFSSGASGNGSTSSLPGTSEGVNGTGKTHHFAVKSRDERIDWMRELMLAKAMKQKGEGFEVSVNGNMI